MICDVDSPTSTPAADISPRKCATLSQSRPQAGILLDHSQPGEHAGGDAGASAREEPRSRESHQVVVEALGAAT